LFISQTVFMILSYAMPKPSEKTMMLAMYDELRLKKVL